MTKFLMRPQKECWRKSFKIFKIPNPHATSDLQKKVYNQNPMTKGFFLPLAFNAPVGVIPLDDLRDFWWVSCRMARLQYGAKNIPEKLNP